jgi:peptidoglycan/LPS O-acetylase OafA/YrhL
MNSRKGLIPITELRNLHTYRLLKRKWQFAYISNSCKYWFWTLLEQNEDRQVPIEKHLPYRTLDGIRGIAATIVMTRHLPELFGKLTFPRCYLAVDLFFVLSGFVIANAYGERLASSMGFRDFMRIRFIRFFPFYLLAFLFGIVVLVMELNAPGARDWTSVSIMLALGAGLFLLPAPFAPEGAFYPLNLPCWSLGFELAVNAFYALIHRWLKTPILLGLIGLSALGVLRYSLYFGGMNYGDGWADLAPGASRVCYSFFAGVLVWRYRGDRRISTIGSVVIGLIVALILLAQMGPMPFDIIMVLGVFPLLVWLAARFEPGDRVAPVFVNLGLASYGVYVIHTPIGEIIQRLAKGSGYTIPIPFVGIIFIIAITAFVLWLDKYFDQPLRRALLKFDAPNQRNAGLNIA